MKGGGVNLGGAILGGVIAGGAGAVVGSRVGTEIKTDIVKEERRKLLLYYYDNGVLRSEQIITSNIDYVLSLLRKWIPDKEFDYVMLNGGVV